MSDTFKKILDGDFKWLMRARIQISFDDAHNDQIKVSPIELHDQVLNNLENRFYEHFEEDRTVKLDVLNGVKDSNGSKSRLNTIRVYRVWFSDL